MDVSCIETHFRSVPDPRTGNAKKYLLHEVLMSAFIATICDANTWEEIANFYEVKLDWLRQYFPLKSGIPSHDTYNRIFSLLDPNELRQCFLKIIDDFIDLLPQQIAIDGKCLRGTAERSNNEDAIYMVSAWACRQQVSMAQFKVQQKTNEITAIPELLQMIRIGGCTITIDAMGCQKSIARLIREKKGHYVLALKENHKHLHEDVAMLFEWLDEHPFDERKTDVYEYTDYGHGRQVTRRCTTIDAIDSLNDKELWTDLTSLARIETTRKVKGKETHETRYYLSSHASNAKRHLTLVRGHWGIENRLHWVLDVVFDEDKNRTRKDFAPENLAVMRQLALNIIRNDKESKKSLNIRRKKAALDNQYAIKLLSIARN